ncbi:MAG TPA: porin family protein [Candidatus Krumholzibacteria bacterium]|nr:porin family protein [Candidatus Krumholzibacteria bacterium]
MCLAVAVVSLLGARTAQAEPRFTLGARTAFYMSDVKAAQEYDPRFGVGGGLFLQANAWKRLDVRVETNYVQKGARLAFSQSSIEWQMDYIETPILLVVNLSPKSKTSVELCAGFSYGFQFQRQVEVGDNPGYDLEAYLDEGDLIPVNRATNLDINSIEDADLAYALGVGLSVPVGAVNFLVDVRYTSSLTDPAVEGEFITTIGEGEDAVTTTTSADFANRVFAFFVGFSFPFGTRETAPEATP